MPQDSDMAPHSQAFPFMRLPKDIRLMVYESLPQEINHINLCGKKSHNEPRGLTKPTLILPHTCAAILATCKDLYDEAIDILTRTIENFIISPPPRIAILNILIPRFTSLQMIVLAGIMQFHDHASGIQDLKFTIPADIAAADEQLYKIVKRQDGRQQKDFTIWLQYLSACKTYQHKTSRYTGLDPLRTPILDVALFMREKTVTREGSSIMDFLWASKARSVLLDLDFVVEKTLFWCNWRSIRVLGFGKVADGFPVEAPNATSPELEDFWVFKHDHIELLPQMTQEDWLGKWTASRL